MMLRRRMIIATAMLSLFVLLSTAIADTSVAVIGGADGPTAVFIAGDAEENTYRSVDPEGAKAVMDADPKCIILDVREQDEYDTGHIPGAILIPYTRIEELAAENLPDKTQTILVYCRSGRRSKIAAETLANMGYTNVIEFGGIIDWPYAIAVD